MLARTVAGLVYVASLVIEVGRVEPLAKPRTVTRKDGTTREIAHKRVIEDIDVASALVKVVLFLRDHDVERVGIERATHFHSAPDPVAASAQAAQLLRAQWLGGEIAGALRAGTVSGVSTVESASSKEWRSAVCKVAKIPERAGAWRSAVCVAIKGMPDTLNEHAVDAAGVAAWLVRSLAVRARREKRASGEGGPRKRVLTEEAKARHREVAREGWRAKAAAERARRIAAGCIGCPRKHVRACPLFVSKAERVAAATG